MDKLWTAKTNKPETPMANSSWNRFNFKVQPNFNPTLGHKADSYLTLLESWIPNKLSVITKGFLKYIIKFR